MFLAERSRTRCAKSQLVSATRARGSASGDALDQPDDANGDARARRHGDVVERKLPAVQIRQIDGEGRVQAYERCRTKSARGSDREKRTARKPPWQPGSEWPHRQTRKLSCMMDRTSHRRRSHRIPPCPSPSWTICSFRRTSMLRLQAAQRPPPQTRRRETGAGIWPNCASDDASPRRRCCPSLRACLTNM